MRDFSLCASRSRWSVRWAPPAFSPDPRPRAVRAIGLDRRKVDTSGLRQFVLVLDRRRESAAIFAAPLAVLRSDADLRDNLFAAAPPVCEFESTHRSAVGFVPVVAALPPAGPGIAVTGVCGDVRFLRDRGSISRATS